MGRTRVRPTPATSPGSRASREPPREAGVLSLEAVWVLPALALLVVGLVLTMGLVRDVLVLHEAARAGARTAATTSGALPVLTAARQAAPELELTVQVTPVARRDGDLVTVWVHTTRMVGPVRHDLSARAVARVEPLVEPSRPEVGVLHGPLAP